MAAENQKFSQVPNLGKLIGTFAFHIIQAMPLTSAAARNSSQPAWSRKRSVGARTTATHTGVKRKIGYATSSSSRSGSRIF